MRDNIKGLCWTAYMDLKRNIALKASLAAVAVSYAALMMLGREKIEESVWTAYAVCSILMALSLPLVYYARFSDKNRKIVQSVVQTKTVSGILYGLLFDLSAAGVFSIAYLCMSLAAGAFLTGKAVSACLIVSVCLGIVIYILLCHVCFEVAQKYVMGLVAYLILVIGLLISNHVFIGVLCPFEYHLYGAYYVLGKFSEIIVLAALNAGIFVRRRMK